MVFDHPTSTFVQAYLTPLQLNYKVLLLPIGNQPSCNGRGLNQTECIQPSFGETMSLWNIKMMNEKEELCLS